MLTVNGEKFNVYDKESNFGKIYQKQLKMLKDFKRDVFIFTYPEEKIRITEEGGEEYPAEFSFPMRQKYVGYEGEFDIQYYENSFHSKDGVENFRPRRFNARRTFSVNINTQPDLLWFLVFVSPHINKLSDYPNINEQQNRIRHIRTFYVLQDRRKTAEKSFEFMEKVTNAQIAIYNTTHGMSDSALKSVAFALGLSNIGDLTEFELRDTIGRKVLRQIGGKYDKNMIEDFLSMIPKKGDDISPEAKALALINEAKECGALVIEDHTASRKKWVLNNGNLITTFVLSANPDKSITNYVMDHPTFVVDLERAIHEVQGGVFAPAKVRQVVRDKKEEVKEDKEESNNLI